MEQMKYASAITSLLGYLFINNETYEADDILGMISKYTYENSNTWLDGTNFIINIFNRSKLVH